MDFIDLKTQQQRIKATLDANVQKVFAHGQYIMGPEVKELEAQLAAYTGAKHAISCASGTDALLMALMALNVGPGDAVFTTPFTFFATAEVVSLLGATPVFVDIDPATFNIDPAKLEKAIQAVKANDPSLSPLPHVDVKAAARKALTPKAVIPVDLFGLPADYDAIDAIAAAHGLAIVEDAAQSFGATYRGRKTCTFGKIACTSFFPAKPLGCYGDGGMCFTDDPSLAAALDSIRVHGKGTHKYDNARIGINGRLDTLQAAILLAKFSIFPEEVILRQEVARRYAQLLAGTSVQTPGVPANLLSAWAQYSVLAKDEGHREELLNRFQSAKIPTAIYYPSPCIGSLSMQTWLISPGDFPISEEYAKRVFSLPMHPYLTEAQQREIAEVTK